MKKEKPLDAEFIKQCADFQYHNQITGEFLIWMDVAGFIRKPGVYGYEITHSIISNCKIWFGIDSGMCTNFGSFINGTNGCFSNTPNPVKFEAVKKYMRVIIKQNLDKLTEQYSQ